MTGNEHVPVLYRQAIDALQIQPEGFYVDATFGRGGHAAGILERLGGAGRLLAFDKDPQAIEVAHQRFSADTRFSIHQGGFAMLQQVLNARASLDPSLGSGLGGGLEGSEAVKVDGILLDLGVSSPQLDDASRGFSFMSDGPLDMRMDTTSGQTAAEWIALATDEEIRRVLWDYGDERFARRIARKVLETRDESPIVTTRQLADLIVAAVPRDKKAKKHPATRSFQAIRIFINRELAELEAVLPQALDVLAINGRLAVISFHSLEDRIVKRFIRSHSRPPSVPRGIPVREQDFAQSPLREVGKQVRADSDELAVNPRARSAVLRIAERRYAS